MHENIYNHAKFGVEQLTFMLSNKYLSINHGIYFHTKSIYRYKYS